MTKADIKSILSALKIKTIVQVKALNIAALKQIAKSLKLRSWKTVEECKFVCLDYNDFISNLKFALTAQIERDRNKQGKKKKK